MAEINQVSIETLVPLSDELIYEYESHCENSPDSFSLVMLETCERIRIIIARSIDETIKAHPDVSGLLRNLFKHRNHVADEFGSKFCQLSPFTAVEAARGVFEWSNDEYISALAYMAYICAKLSLRHHLRGNFARAAMYAQDAMICTDVMCHFLPISYVDRRTRSFLASQAVLSKIATDPKQKEKKFVCECWKEWQEQPDRYKGKAAFARDMLNKCEYLESQKKIEDWCREWEKANPAG